MRYRDLKDERDDAIARAIAAEKLSMKSEVDRIRAECDERVRVLEARCEGVDDVLAAVATIMRTGDAFSFARADLEAAINELVSAASVLKAR